VESLITRAIDAPGRAARLLSLTIRDFRNLARVELTSPEAGFAIVGDNGHGKTNLLEAIYYCHLFRSLRGGGDAELVRFGARAFHVAACTAGPHDQVAAGYERASRRKKITVDGVECARLSDALGALLCVAFSPSDVAIVSGAASLRRRFLDVTLASTSRPYLTALQQYRAALVRRNAALRAAGGAAGAAPQVRVWEVPLARHGAVLWRERTAWVQWARAHFGAICGEIGERERGDLRYRSTVPVPDGATDEMAREAMAASFAEHRARDLVRGLSHAGPHRDDLDMRLGAHGIRAYGSAGQQRTAAVALRLLERLTYIERHGRQPVVLLDDPFAELDRQRAASILTLLTARGAGQAVFAVPRPDDIPPALTDLARFRVREGALAPW
jgi:DNA replication and repair protein RecF